VWDCDVSGCYTTSDADCVPTADCGWAEESATRMCADRPEHQGRVVCTEFDNSAPGLWCETSFICCDHDGDGPTCWSESIDGHVYVLGAEEQLVCDVCDITEDVEAYVCP